MPGINGEMVAESVKNYMINTPILAISACPDGGAQASSLNFAGMFSEDVLPKPFKKEQILDAVEKVLL